MRTYFRICDRCGAHLDPCERCGCERKKKEPGAITPSPRKEDPGKIILAFPVSVK